jgi:acylphosphatase
VTPPGVTSRRAIVRGRVQGVGYRFFAERVARELGIRGWVRNLADGTVETLAAGEDEAVRQYLERLRKGPHGSRVDALDVSEVSDEEAGRHTSFEITR